jgi:hypothetical protein
MPTSTQVDAVVLVRSQLEQAHREGRRAPGRPTLVEATGLTDHAVRTALDKIKEEITSSDEPRGTASQPHHQISRTGGDADADDHQVASRTDDHQHTSSAGDRQPTAGPKQPHRQSTSPAASKGELSAPPPADTDRQRSPGAKVNHLSLSSVSPEAGCRAGGTAVSWLGFAFGSITSIAANVLHTWLPAATQPPGWTPGTGPQIGAGVWPVALIVTVEVLVRVSWRRTWFWNVVRYGIGTIVAAGSFAISYGHIHAVLTAWHYDPIAAAVGSLVLDGLMTVSGFALLTAEAAHAGVSQPKVKT